MADRKSLAREIAALPVRHWRASLVVLLLAPVLGPAIAVYCLVAGGHAIDESRSPRVAGQFSFGEKLAAMAAAVLPAAIYGCAIWALRVVVPSSHWMGWVVVLLMAGLVGVVAGFLPAMYVFGYALGVAQAAAELARPR